MRGADGASRGGLGPGASRRLWGGRFLHRFAVPNTKNPFAMGEGESPTDYSSR